MTGGDRNTDSNGLACERAKREAQLELRRESLRWGNDDPEELTLEHRRQPMKARPKCRRQQCEEALALSRQTQAWTDQQTGTDTEEDQDA